MTNDDLIILPRPTLWAILFEGYRHDTNATEAYYNSFFDGATATDVLRSLKANDIFHTFHSESTLGLLVTENTGMVTYSAGISLHFENGLFTKAELTSGGIK